MTTLYRLNQTQDFAAQNTITSPSIQYPSICLKTEDAVLSLHPLHIVSVSHSRFEDEILFRRFPLIPSVVISPVLHTIVCTRLVVSRSSRQRTCLVEFGRLFSSFAIPPCNALFFPSCFSIYAMCLAVYVRAWRLLTSHCASHSSFPSCLRSRLIA